MPTSPSPRWTNLRYQKQMGLEPSVQFGFVDFSKSAEKLLQLYM